MTQSDHALIIGGTGMLRDVTLHLAETCSTVSVVARTQARLTGIVHANARRGLVHPIAVDYTDKAAFESALLTAIDEFGPMTTAVVWMHSTAPRGPRQLAGLINDALETATSPSTTQCDYLNVLGSSAAEPNQQTLDDVDDFATLKHIHYRKVILGFVMEGNRSRWLCRGEIAKGVINALRTGRDETIVGTVKPWSARP